MFSTSRRPLSFTVELLLSSSASKFSNPTVVGMCKVNLHRDLWTVNEASSTWVWVNSAEWQKLLRKLSQESKAHGRRANLLITQGFNSQISKAAEPSVPLPTKEQAESKRKAMKVRRQSEALYSLKSLFSPLGRTRSQSNTGGETLALVPLEHTGFYPGVNHLMVKIKLSQWSSAETGNAANFRFSCFLSSFGISLLNTVERQEISYFILQRLELNVLLTNDTMELSTSIGHVQLDDQTLDPDYPVVLV